MPDTTPMTEKQWNLLGWAYPDGIIQCLHTWHRVDDTLDALMEEGYIVLDHTDDEKRYYRQVKPFPHPHGTGTEKWNGKERDIDATPT